MAALLKLYLDKLFRYTKVMKGPYEFEALRKEQSDSRASRSEEVFRRKDLFTALLEARDLETGSGLTAEELVAGAGALIVARTDTTATSLTATIFYLIHYPHALDHLEEEI